MSALGTVGKMLQNSLSRGGAKRAKKNPAPEAKDDKQPLSGDAARPYAKGRAYDPTHYGKKAAAQSADAPTEE